MVVGRVLSAARFYLRVVPATAFSLASSLLVEASSSFPRMSRYLIADSFTDFEKVMVGRGYSALRAEALRVVACGSTISLALKSNLGWLLILSHMTILIADSFTRKFQILKVMVVGKLLSCALSLSPRVVAYGHALSNTCRSFLILSPVGNRGFIHGL